MKSVDKIDNILQNYINGNIETTKKAIKRLTKSETMELMAALADYYSGDLSRAFDAISALVQ